MTSHVEAKRKSQDISSIPNVSYDLITVFQNKMQAIAAMEEYKLDCEEANDRECLSLFEDLERREREDIQRLRAFVKDRL